MYGLAPIVNALTVNRRDWNLEDENDDYFDDEESSMSKVKPSARLETGLFVQDGKKYQGSGKAQVGQEIISLAKDR